MSARRSALRSDDGRLRAWLRITIVVVVVVVADAAVSVVALLFDAFAAQRAATGLVGALVAVGVLVVAIRRLDHRGVSGYGLNFDRTWWQDLAAGAAIGLTVPALAFGGMLLGGWMEVTEVLSAGTDEALWTGLAAATITYIGVGVYEELLFRGYFVSNAAEAFAVRRPPATAVLWAITVSTLVFAAVHPAILTSQAPAWLAALFYLAMGAILGAAYAFTGRLGLPIGLHITFNLAGNHLFPLAAPPEEFERASVVFRAAADGPDWITGVGGAAMVVATLFGGALVYGWIRLRHRPVAIDPKVAQAEDRPVRDGARPTVATAPDVGANETEPQRRQ